MNVGGVLPQSVQEDSQIKNCIRYPNKVLMQFLFLYKLLFNINIKFYECHKLVVAFIGRPQVMAHNL